MKMTAAVMYEQGRPLPYAESRAFEIEEVDLEGPGEGEVLVEVRAAGLCHSDLSVMGGLRKRKLPVVGGHEGAGIVREVGPGVRTLEPGDHVVLSAAGGCGHCRQCVRGRPGTCDSIGASRAQGLLPNGSVKLSKNGKPVYHYSGMSCFAEYVVTVPGCLVEIDQAVPLDVAAVFGCAVVTGVGAVLNAAQVRAGDNVVVFGLGGVGLNAVMGARVAGASNIIGIDVAESKFDLAKLSGCTHTFLADDPDLPDKVREISDGGVDFAFEVSGAEVAVRSAFGLLRKGGEVICVGLRGAGDQYSYPHTQLVSEEKGIRGSLMGSGVGARDIPKYLGFYQQGRLPVERLQSGTITFDRLNHASDQLHDGEVVRQILLPHGEGVRT